MKPKPLAEPLPMTLIGPSMFHFIDPKGEVKIYVTGIDSQELDHSIVLVFTNENGWDTIPNLVFTPVAFSGLLVTQQRGQDLT